jgi:hypothetical protein
MQAFTGDVPPSKTEENLVGLEGQNDNRPTIIERLFKDRNVNYPFSGSIDRWGNETYVEEKGLTEFTEYKFLRGIYDKVILSKENSLPATVYYGASTARLTLAARAPTLWQAISEAITGGLSSARSAFTYLASAIVSYVQNGGLPEGLIGFGTFSKGYLAEYASKLVEKFVSYTVQLQVSGTKLAAKGVGDSYIGVFDHLAKTGQHMVIGDSFYGLADRDQVAEGNPNDESTRINPPTQPSIMGDVPGDYLPMNDVLVGFKMFQQITYHPDRYGIVSNPFGTRTVTPEYAAANPVWKWDSFKTNDYACAHIVNPGTP